MDAIRSISRAHRAEMGAAVHPFAYQRPHAQEEVLELLANSGQDAAVLAGGQSLIPAMNLGKTQPRVLIDINRLHDTVVAKRVGDNLAVGPLVRHHDLETVSEIPLLPMAARLIGHPAVRNRGTFLGSLAQADATAEWPAVALALSATLRLVSLRGERTVSANEFFLGAGRTARQSDEFLTAAYIPVAPARSSSAIHELNYRHNNYALIGVLAHLTLDADGRIAQARVVSFGTQDRPIRLSQTEAVLTGTEIGAFSEAAYIAEAEVEPFSDVHASASYRRAMVGVFVRRALNDAYGRAAGEVA